jgi:hypothetical protein
MSVLLIAVMLALTACKNTAPSTLTPVPTRLMAELTGTLLIDSGCPRLILDYTETNYLLVFVPELRVTVKGEALSVLNEVSGETVVVHNGETVYLVGGEVKRLSQFDGAMQTRVPSDCAGPYWITGSVELIATPVPGET